MAAAFEAAFVAAVLAALAAALAVSPAVWAAALAAFVAAWAAWEAAVAAESAAACAAVLAAFVMVPMAPRASGAVWAQAAGARSEPATTSASERGFWDRFPEGWRKGMAMRPAGRAGFRESSDAPGPGGRSDFPGARRRESAA